MDAFVIQLRTLSMARQLRTEYEGAIYHMMNRGDRGEQPSRRIAFSHADLW